MTERLEINPCEDPWGYADAYRKAIARWNEADTSLKPAEREARAGWVLRCLGRCRVYSITLDEQLVELSVALMESGLHRLCLQMKSAIAECSTLAERWYVTLDPWEADALCLDLLRLRTDLFGFHLAIPDVCEESASGVAEFQQLLESFDTALRSVKSTLCTVIDASEYETLRDDVAASVGIEELPWWLGRELVKAVEQNAADAEHSLPPQEVVSLASRLQSWRRLLPPEIVPALLAAAVAEETFSYETLTLVWQCAGASSLRAELLLPTESSKTAECELRPLSFWKRTETGMERAVELAGTIVRLGVFQGVLDEKAEVRLTIRDLRVGCDGLLFVGDEQIPWSPRQE